MFNYVYKTTCPDTGEYYIGSRMSRVPFEEDKKYFGSGMWIKSVRGKFLEKEFISYHNTRKEAMINETKIIKEHCKDDKNMNIGCVGYSEQKVLKHMRLREIYRENLSCFRHTLSLSEAADKLLMAHAKKTGLKISTIIEQLLVKMGGEK